LEAAIDWLFELFSLPKVGLPAVFLIALISATLLPLGSEPAVFAYVKMAPDMFWPCVLVATAGNVVGGMIDWWMGHEARKAWILYRRKHRLAGGTDDQIAARKRPKLADKWFGWMERFGPPVLILSWLPGVGDPRVRGRRMVAHAVAALPAVDDDRKAAALYRDDFGAAVGPGQLLARRNVVVQVGRENVRTGEPAPPAGCCSRWRVERRSNGARRWRRGRC
jgi:membrane protein YqaA with SNARE-associated domain